MKMKSLLKRKLELLFGSVVLDSLAVGVGSCRSMVDSTQRDLWVRHTPRPEFILLDLNLPKIGGREVLADIKEDPHLKTIPTVILTTSNAEADIVKSYERQANCYLSKPVQLDAFESQVKGINDFWLTQVKFPNRRQIG